MLRAALCCVLFLILAIAPSGPDGTAIAQTATNLKCKGCVGKKDIGKKAVGKKHIKKNAVTGQKIKNGTIRAADLAASAIELGVDYAEGVQAIGFTTGVDTVVRSVTISAPRDGYVLVNASGRFNLPDSASVECSISSDSSLDPVGALRSTHSVAMAFVHMPLALTRVFPVSEGDAVFNLVCREMIDEVNMYNTSITALFVPNRY